MQRSTFFCLAWLIATAAMGAANSPVCLTREDAQQTPVHSPLLVRELFRQGVLIAARDQMQLTTRDQALREPFPNGIIPISLQWALTRDKVDITLVRDGKPLWQGSISWQSRHDIGHIYQMSLEASERLARTDWPEMLQKTGYTGAPAKPSDNAPAPPEAFENLDHLDIEHQFHSVRLAHAAIAASGSSPQRLGILVRGYANLGRLTDALWCADSDVFAARSLLYSQRMVAEHPASPYALWHRAYAYALAGCQSYALNDLAAAQKLIQAAQNSDPPALAKPAWVDVIDAFCREDIGALSKATSQDQTAPLAALLRFFCVEFSGSDTAVVSYDQAALRLSPQCARLTDAMNLIGGLGVMEQSTSESFTLLHQSIAGLDSWADLPAAVKVELKKPEDTQNRYLGDSKVAAALANCDDTAEPSYSVLGRLFQEQMFSNVFSKAYLLDHMLGVDATDFVQSNMPLISDHPYHAWLKVMMGKQRDPNHYSPLAKIKLIDPTALMFTRMHDDAWAKTGGANPAVDAWNFLVREHDITSQAMEMYIMRIYSGKDHTRTVMAHHLLGISPHDAIAQAVLITNDYDSVQNRVARWQRDGADHPTLLMALADHYIDAGQYAEAKDALQQRITVMPDVGVFTKLADLYLKQNDEADWLKEMQDALQQPAYGLEQPNIQVAIANHYMDEKKFKEAKSYADAAADSYAAFGMSCAIRCDEGLADWDGAAKWAETRAERYGNTFEWYAWCERTGHGDLAKATAAMRAEVAGLTPEAGRETLANAFEFYLLQKDYPDAIKTAREIFHSTRDTWAGMHLALLLEQKGDRASAEEALERVQKGTVGEAETPQRKQMIAVASLMHDSLTMADKGGSVGKLDLQAVQKASAGASKRDQAHINFFVARFLEINGQSPEKVQELLKSAADVGEASSSSVLAAAELRERKP